MKKIKASLIKRLLRINSQTFVGSFLELSLYYLSLILLETQSFLRELLEECGILRVLEQEGKGRVGKRKRTSGSTTTTGFACRYQVAYMISLLFLACMCVFGSLAITGMGFSRHDNGFMPCISISRQPWCDGVSLTWLSLIAE